MMIFRAEGVTPFLLKHVEHGIFTISNNMNKLLRVITSGSNFEYQNYAALVIRIA